MKEKMQNNYKLTSMSCFINSGLQRFLVSFLFIPCFYPEILIVFLYSRSVVDLHSIDDSIHLFEGFLEL